MDNLGHDMPTQHIRYIFTMSGKAFTHAHTHIHTHTHVCMYVCVYFDILFHRLVLNYQYLYGFY